jgi:hypothetical protein
VKALWNVRALIVAAFAVAVAVPVWFQIGGLQNYGGPYLWPGLVGNFTASFFAFVLALAWDRRMRADELAKEEEQFRQRRDEEAEAEEERRKTDARRLLVLVVEELDHDHEAVRELVKLGVKTAPLAFQIRTGTWERSADNLGQLLSKSDLVAKTSGLYDRLSELRWRLRFIAEADRFASQLRGRHGLETAVDATNELVREIDDDFDQVLDLIRQESWDPAVDLLGIRRVVAIQDTLGPRANFTWTTAPDHNDS